jgi:hypothetical protein
MYIDKKSGILEFETNLEKNFLLRNKLKVCEILESYNFEPNDSITRKHIMKHLMDLWNLQQTHFYFPDELFTIDN